MSRKNSILSLKAEFPDILCLWAFKIPCPAQSSMKKALYPRGLIHRWAGFIGTYWGSVRCAGKKLSDVPIDDAHKVFSVAKGTDISIKLDVLWIRTWWLLSWDVEKSLTDWPQSACEQLLSISQSYRFMHQHQDADHFNMQLQEIIDQAPKKDVLVVQKDWNAKARKDAQADRGDVCGPYCYVGTNKRRSQNSCNI